MQRTRQVFAVVAVTTALCADQAALAAPNLRPQVAQIVVRLASRLTHGFQRNVPQAIPTLQRQPNKAVILGSTVSAPQQMTPHRPASPFEHRLPPPTR